MSRRTSVVRHDTEDIQGEGSFVVLSALKVKEIRWLRAQDEEFDQFEGGIAVLQHHVVDWNWVDDAGEPLPLPKDDPTVIDELTNEEAELLSELLRGAVEAKN